MPINVRALLPALLSPAVAWAEARERDAVVRGRRLTDTEVVLAQGVGVQHPENIRIMSIQRLPLPDHAGLRAAALETGLLGPNMVGLTLGYAVYICHGHETTRLLSHEFRHVYQYETAGSVASFLPVYLRQIVDYGYDRAPFEVDALAHEYNQRSK